MPRAPPAARCIPRAFPFLPPPPGGRGQHRAPPAASAAEGPVGTLTEFRSQGWKKKENTEVVGHCGCPLSATLPMRWRRRPALRYKHLGSWIFMRSTPFVPNRRLNVVALAVEKFLYVVSQLGTQRCYELLASHAIRCFKPIYFYRRSITYPSKVGTTTSMKIGYLLESI